MKIEDIAAQLTIDQIKDFVTSIHNIVNQLLIPLPSQQVEVNKSMDYTKMPNYVPKGGWINPTELRQKNQEMIEAITNEKWLDGFIKAFQLLVTIIAI